MSGHKVPYHGGGGSGGFMKRHEFERVVDNVLEDLPRDFAEKMENIDVVVEDRPSQADLHAAGVKDGWTLLGLYKGVPRTKRGMGYMLIAPDQISIYKEPIEMDCRQTGVPEAELVRKVVLHEIAHYFGISDSRLRELGY